MSSEAEDEYERQYMDPGERVLFREKVVSQVAFRVSVAMAVIFGLGGLAGIVAGLVTPAAGLPAVALGATTLAFGVAMGALGVLFSVFRSLVTESHLHVHFGWTKTKIPYAEMTAVRAVELRGFRQGKVSLGVDGVVRTWVGQGRSRRAIEVAYQPEGARKHVITIGSDQADRFLAALERARASAQPTSAGVRVGEAELAAEDAPIESEGDASRGAARSS